MPDPTDHMADHVRETVEEIIAVHAEHYRAHGRLQRLTDRLTAALARPVFLAVLVVVIGAWLLSNGLFMGEGRAIDPPPFAMLELAATLAALVFAILILVTQRREDALAERRAQLTLELAMLGERKTAKVIALLEELRRDMPSIADRVDPESEAMAAPADARAVLTALEADAGDHGQRHARPSGKRGKGARPSR